MSNIRNTRSINQILDSNGIPHKINEIKITLTKVRGNNKTKKQRKNFESNTIIIFHACTLLNFTFFLSFRVYPCVHVVRYTLIPTINRTRITWSTDEPRLPPRCEAHFMASLLVPASPTKGSQSDT